MHTRLAQALLRRGQIGDPVADMPAAAIGVRRRPVFQREMQLRGADLIPGALAWIARTWSGVQSENIPIEATRRIKLVSRDSHLHVIDAENSRHA